jgi:hypothetical protein
VKEGVFQKIFSEEQERMPQPVLPPPGRTEQPQELFQAVGGSLITLPPHKGTVLSIVVFLGQVEAGRWRKAQHVLRWGMRTERGWRARKVSG